MSHSMQQRFSFHGVPWIGHFLHSYCVHLLLIRLDSYRGNIGASLRDSGQAIHTFMCMQIPQNSLVCSKGSDFCLQKELAPMLRLTIEYS